MFNFIAWSIVFLFLLAITGLHCTIAAAIGIGLSICLRQKSA
jgi:hypothetical protein